MKIADVERIRKSILDTPYFMTPNVSLGRNNDENGQLNSHAKTLASKQSR